MLFTKMDLFYLPGWVILIYPGGLLLLTCYLPKWVSVIYPDGLVLFTCVICR